MKKSLWLLAMCALLAGCGNSSKEPRVAGRWYAQSQVDLGKKVYAENCIECHLEKAQGTTSWRERSGNGAFPPPPLNGTAHAWHHPLKLLKKTIDEGGVRLGGTMPGFKARLKNEESLAVIAYFQSFWTNEIYAEWLNRGGLK